jgi:hypothetical protein
MAAAMLDILWSVPSYERLITAWKLDGDQATQAITWVMDMLVDAIRHDRRPRPEPGHRQRPQLGPGLFGHWNAGER